MQVTLTSKKYQRKHTFNLVVRDDEIILTTPNGDEFANLQVSTAEKDEKQEDGSYKTVPTNSFFIAFSNVAESGIGKDIAFVQVDE